MLKIKSTNILEAMDIPKVELAWRLPNNANDHTDVHTNPPWAVSCMRPSTVPWIGIPPFPIKTENERFNMVPDDQQQQGILKMLRCGTNQRFSRLRRQW
jgi:hypothetical protein